MPSFSHDGLSLAYDDLAPDGPPERTVMLVHGYASNRAEAWKRTGWYMAFQRRGMRVIAPDLRGHGESDKPHDPQAYGRDKLAGDVLALLDHLGIGRVDLIGYSMGAHTALAAALRAPERISNLVLGGVGARIFEAADPDAREIRAQAMLAEDPQSIEDRLSRGFREFAEMQGDDRQALAAFVRAEYSPLDPAAAGGLPMPVLAVAGVMDQIAGDPQALADLFPQAHAVSVPGCDHFSAIPHALTKAAVFDFIDGMLDDPFPPFR